MTLSFDWTERSPAEWRQWLARAPRANWMQSPPYAGARRRLDQRHSRWALIRDDAVPVGMMALEEIRLGPLHIIELRRGPLWFAAEPPERWFREFAELFDRTFPARWLRRRRWLPEWEHSERAIELLREAGFAPTEQGYHTSWIDVTRPWEQIESSFHKKWRNGLRKAERSGLLVKLDGRGETLELFVKRYEEHLRRKRYHGSSPAFVRAEFLEARASKDALLLWAFDEVVPVAAVVIAFHGVTASYRFGWSSPAGRAKNAHSLLLARAIALSQERGLQRFDLGGLLPGEADGLTEFKRGLGGQEVRLVGMFK